MPKQSRRPSIRTGEPLPHPSFPIVPKDPVWATTSETWPLRPSSSLQVGKEPMMPSRFRCTCASPRHVTPSPVRWRKAGPNQVKVSGSARMTAPRSICGSCCKRSGVPPNSVVRRDGGGRGGRRCNVARAKDVCGWPPPHDPVERHSRIVECSRVSPSDLQPQPPSLLHQTLEILIPFAERERIRPRPLDIMAEALAWTDRQPHTAKHDRRDMEMHPSHRRLGGGEKVR